MSAEPPLVLFDGVCGLCNRAVDYILTHDTEHAYRFAPLQGQTAARYLSAEERAHPDTLILIKEDQVYRRSQAVLQIASRLRLPFLLKVATRLAQLIPTPIADQAYKLVASTRYRLWGKANTCRLPTAKERSYFLD